MDERSEPIEIAPAPPRRRAGFPRPVLLAVAAIVALVALGLFVAVGLPDRPTRYPAGSAEAAFQDFYRAWEARDIEGAYGLLSPEVKAELSLSEYRRLDTEQSWQRERDRRVVLLGVDLTGDRAILDIRVDQFSEGGLGGRRDSFDRSVRLVRVGGAWLIDEPLVGIESDKYGY